MDDDATAALARNNGPADDDDDFFTCRHGATPSPRLCRDVKLPPGAGRRRFSRSGVHGDVTLTCGVVRQRTWQMLRYITYRSIIRYIRRIHCHRARTSTSCLVTLYVIMTIFIIMRHMSNVRNCPRKYPVIHAII